MNTHSKNQIENIQFLSLNQLSVEEEDHFADALDLFSKRVWCAPQIADIPDIMIIDQIYHAVVSELNACLDSLCTIGKRVKSSLEIFEDLLSGRFVISCADDCGPTLHCALP